MNAYNERVMLAGHNLGSLDQLDRFTRAIEATTAALQAPTQRWTVDDLWRFQRDLDSAGAVIARLDRSVRSQIACLQGVTTDAG